jgi:hypothetical protein
MASRTYRSPGLVHLWQWVLEDEPRGGRRAHRGAQQGSRAGCLLFAEPGSWGGSAWVSKEPVPLYGLHNTFRPGLEDNTRHRSLLPPDVPAGGRSQTLTMAGWRVSRTTLCRSPTKVSRSTSSRRREVNSSTVLRAS